MKHLLDFVRRLLLSLWLVSFALAAAAQLPGGGNTGGPPGGNGGGGTGTPGGPGNGGTTGGPPGPNASVSTITGFTPASGPVGTVVTVTGTNLTGTTSVAFNGVNAPVFTVNSGTELTVTVPSGASTGLISVATPGSTATSTNSFTVTLPVTALGNVVTLNGSSDYLDLPGHAALQITGNMTVEAMVRLSALQSGERIIFINCIEPDAWGMHLSVSDNRAQASVLAGGVPNHLLAPTALPLNQWAHLAAVRNGTTLSLYVNGVLVASRAVPAGALRTGTGLSRIGKAQSFSTPLAGQVDEVRVWNVARTASQLQADLASELTGAESGLAGYWDMNRTGQGAGLTVANRAAANGPALSGVTVGTATTPVFTPVNAALAPAITGFTPASGVAGTSVTITGTNLTGASSVWFNGLAAAFSNVTGTSLQATVPAGASTGPISVGTPQGVGSSAAAFVVPTAPVVSGFTPTSGPAGTNVTITGTSLGGATSVTFGGVAATVITNNTATSLTVVAPASGTTGPICVTTALGTGCSTASYSYPPTISTGTVAPQTFCAGGTIQVPFTTSMSGYAGGNTFGFQLSNASGVFDPLGPVYGTLISSGSTGGTLSGALPNTTAGGSGYRVRVVSTDPAIVGSANGASLTISPTPVSQAGGPAAVPYNSSIGLTLTPAYAGAAYSWSGPFGFASTQQNPTVANATNVGVNRYTCVVTLGSCTFSSFVDVTVQAPAAPVLTLAPFSGPLCAAAPFTLSFNATGMAYAAGNTITAQLSSASGSFATPVSIGSVAFSGQGSGSLTASLPAGTAGTSGYRIRLVGSSPASTSNDNGASLTVNGAPAVALAAFAPVCVSASPFALSGGSPAGGTYHVDGTAASTFSPAAAGAGTHTIAYSYTDGSGCSATATRTVEVRPLPTVTLAALAPACAAAPAYALSGGSPAGGTYSGPGVSGGQFNPATAGVGTHTITYSYADATGCAGSASRQLTVLPTPTFASTTTQVCTGQPVTLTVSNAGAGAAYLWSPGGATTASITASPAAQTTYSVVVTSAAGCTYSFSQTVSISPYTTTPGVVSLSVPAANAQDLNPAATTLSWAPASQASGYDVYIWLASDPAGQPTSPQFANVTAINLALGTGMLAYGQTYSWKVVARNPCFSRASATRSFTTRHLPDLRVTALAAPATAVLSQSLTVSWTVRNSGAGSTGSAQWNDYVYISLDHDLRTAEDMLLGQFPNQQALQPNQAYTQTHNVTLPSTLPPGGYHLYVITNANDAYCQGTFINGTDSCSIARGHHNSSSMALETTTQNNWRHQPLMLQFPAAVPDLVVTSVAAPGVAFTSAPLNVTYRLKNKGNAAAQGDLFTSGSYNCAGHYWYDYFYLSQDSLLSPGTDRLLTRSLTHPRWVRNGGINGCADQLRPLYSDVLEVDSSLVIRPDIRLPHNLLSGTYYVLAATDAAGNVLEGYGENNNVRASTPVNITMAPPPDLIVNRVTAPASAGVGQTLSLSWTVENDGAKAPDTSENTWYDKVYLSRLPTFNPDSVLVLGEFTSNAGSGFGPGATYNVAQSFTLPRGLSGQFYVYVWTDARNQVFEYNADGNNITRSPGRVTIAYTTYPDLVVTSISLPDTIVFGQPYTMSWTLQNQGQAATTAAFANRVLAALDTILTNPFTVQGTVPYGSLLQPGQSITQQITHIFPYQPAYANRRAYFFVRADSDDAIYEYGHENNNQSGSHRVGRGGVFMKVVVTGDGPPPVHDLRVLSLSAPASIGSGSSLTLTARVRNFGPDSITNGNWRDVVYLSADSVLDASDQYLNSASRSAHFSGGNSYTQPQTINVPNGISGSYYLLYSAGESAYGVYDARPANNVLARPLAIQLTPPADIVASGLTVPDTLYAGQTVRLPFRITNQGAGAALPNQNRWYVGAYLGSSPGLNNTYLQVGSLALNQPLAAGATLADSITVTVPRTYLGNYYLILKGDNSNDIYEHTAEGNNTRSQLTYVRTAPESDLVITAVEGPAAAQLGIPATMSYTVRNQGAHPTLGTITNNLYVSNQSPFASNQDRFFGQQAVSQVLAPGAQLTRTVTATPLSLKPGYYRSIAQANALQNVFESSYTNNRLVSADSTRWDVAVLPLGVLVGNIPLAAGDHRFYQLTVGANLDVLLTLNSSLTSGTNEMFVAYDRIPTSSSYDYRFTTPESPNQQIVLPATQAGIYYIYVRNASQSPPQQVSLLAQALPYSIRSITPATVGKGVVTTTLNGAGFRAGIRVRLRNSSNAVAATAQVTRFTSTMELKLRWDLTAVPAGTYTVETENPNGDVQQLANGLRVVTATPYSVDYMPLIPGSIRAGRSGVFTYSFRNSSNVDLPVLHGQFSMFSSISISDVRALAGNPLLGSNWDVHPQPSLPIRDWYAPGDNMVYVPFMARNVPPGGEVTIQFTAGLQNFKGGQLTVHPVAYIYDVPALLTRVGGQLEVLRRAMQADPVTMNVSNAPELMSLIPNRRAFTDSMLTRYFEIGLLQPQDTTGFDFACDSCLGLTPALPIAGDFGPVGEPVATDTSNVVFGPNGVYRWEINKYAGRAGQNPGWDLLRVQGALSIQATPAQPYLIKVASLTYYNDPGLLAGWYPAVDASWPIAIAQGGITGFAANKFAIDISEFTSFNNVYGGTFSIHQIGDTLKLAFTATRPGVGMPGIPGAPGAPGEPGSPGGKGGPGSPTVRPGKGGKGGSGGPAVPALPGSFAGGGYSFPPDAPPPGSPAGNGADGGDGGDPDPGAATTNPSAATSGDAGDGGNAGDLTLNPDGSVSLPGRPGLPGDPGDALPGFPEGASGSSGSASSFPDSDTGGSGGAGGPGTPGCVPIKIPNKGCESTLSLMNDARKLLAAAKKNKLPSKLTSIGLKYLAKYGLENNCGLQALTLGAADVVGLVTSVPTSPFDMFLRKKDAIVSGMQLGMRLTSCAVKDYYPDVAPFVQSWVDGLDCIKGGTLGELGYSAATCAAKFIVCVPIVRPCDPNEIQGPAGYGPSKMVAATATLPYKVLFENDAEQASASAQRVNIRLPIDDNLNPLSVRLGDVSFHNRTFSLPTGLASYHTVFPLADSIGVNVELTAGVDVVNRELFWEFQAIDAATGLPPANPLAGFLPANDSTHAGEGFVTFTVRSRRGVVTGDSIRAKAAITFDFNDVIDTNTALNIIDAVAPHSLVSPIATAADSVYQIQVATLDDTGGSGVSSFDLYVSEDGQNYQPYLVGLTASPVSFTAQAGQAYYFYALATDNVGNVEGPKTNFEAFISACPLPTAVAVSNITANSATLSFGSNAAATGGYTAVATPTTGPAITVTGAGSPLQLTGLQSGMAYSVRVTSNCGSSTAAANPVLFSTTGGDLLVSTALPVTGIYRNVTITGTGIATLSGPLTVSGTLTVQSGGVLNSNCELVSGTGSFVLAAGASLRICDPAGISLSGATGSIQVASSRSFSTDASYIYDGQQSQVTGPGLPAQVRNLSNVGQRLTLSQAVSVARVLEANADFATNGNACTLLSSAQGTALVKYGFTTSPVMSGSVTVQRWIDPSLNPGYGYRHYSSPVLNAPFSDLTTPGFTPTLNAAYNTSAQPTRVTPFPSVFGYDEARTLATGNNLSGFDKGWFSPTGSFVTGQGYTVNIPASEKVDFVGTLYNGTLTLPLGRTPSVEAGWHLVGNPYASPLDWSLVARPTGLDAAMYVFSSTSRYLGVYRAYVNGIGAGSPIVPSAQGFFVRAAAATSLSITNAARVTEFRTTDPTFQRANDPRPRLQLRLQGGTTAAPVGEADASHLYFEAGATTGVDAEFDAVKLPNPSGLNLASDGPGVAAGLAINGLPATSLTAATTLPLHVAVPAAGTYTLQAAELLNLPATVGVVLTDLRTGRRIDLRQQPSYQFTAAETDPATGRFYLNLSPVAGPLATAGLTTATVSVFPNPARQQLTVLVPGVATATRVEATLLNALGQEVRRQQAALPATGSRLTFDVQGLAAGMYVLRLQAGSEKLMHRVVVE